MLAATAAALPIAVAAARPSAAGASAPQHHALVPLIGVSPIPGSHTALPTTQISIVGVPASKIGTIRVIGSVTGVHGGRLLAYSQGDGASFVPTTPFRSGEEVTVITHLGIDQVRNGTFHFKIATPVTTTGSSPRGAAAASLGRPAGSEAAAAEATNATYVSRPDLSPPLLTVTKNLTATSPGALFVAPTAGPGQSGPMIVSSSGVVEWFHPVTDGAHDFRVQTYEGKPALTWWEGAFDAGHGVGDYVVMNGDYQQIATVKAGNGLMGDLHEFRIYPNGTALLTSYEPIDWDLSAAGGPADGVAFDSIVQEIDLKTGLVRFQWDSLDHVGVTESYAPVTTSRNPWDYLHVNSAAFAPNGSLLISGRDTWAAYDVDPVSGKMIWRLGGKRSSFTMGPDAAFAWQHDVQWHPNGTISMFDDEGSPDIGPQSRGLILSLDTVSRTATYDGEWDHSPSISTGSQGNVQYLPDGHVLIDWGAAGDVSEYAQSGTLLYDADFNGGYESYRAFRSTWIGTPASPPSLAVRGGDRQ